jgi:hypothetical protein
LNRGLRRPRAPGRCQNSARGGHVLDRATRSSRTSQGVGRCRATGAVRTIRRRRPIPSGADYAKVLIIDELTPPMGSSVLLNPVPAIDCLLQAAIDLGGTGCLDDLVLYYSADGRQQQRLTISEKLGLPDTPQIRLLARAAASPDWPAVHQAISQSLMDDLNPIALRLLETVSEHIRAEPYELPGRSTWLMRQTRQTEVSD